MNAFRFGLVVEQTLGHVTHCQNLRAQAEADPSIEADWIGVPYHSQGLERLLPLVRSNWSLRASLRVRRHLHDAPYRSWNAMLIHTQVSALLSVGLMRQVPTILSLDATPASKARLAPPRMGAALLAPWKRRATSRALDAARGVVAWNGWTRRSLIHDYQVPASKIDVIPPGVDLELWHPQARAPRKLPRVLFAGRNFTRKGGPLLVEFVRHALAGQCTLDVVTSSPEVEPAENIRVHRHLRPNAAELRRLFAQADLFVLPTQEDCMPLVIFEAMASGLPVIASDVGAIGEQVLDGETGLLVPRGNGAALAAALGALLRDPARRAAYGAAGRARAVERFDAQRNYRALLQRLKEVSARQLSAERRSPTTEPAELTAACQAAFVHTQGGDA